MKQQSRLWFLMGKQLSSALTVTEIGELDDLLAENPELWYSYELLQSVIGLNDIPESFIAEFRSLLDKNVEVDQVNQLMLAQIDQVNEPSVRPRRTYKKTITYAAAAVLAVMLLWFGLAQLNKNPGTEKVASIAMNEVVAPKGSKTRIILVDGTSIWLNGGSRLKYPKNFSMENREVYLIGEGYFEVVHNSKHSFVVHTKNADIVDLGTTFNVKAYEESKTTETTLIEGSLEVVLKNKTAKRILIKPKEKVVLHPDDQYKVISVVPYAKTNDVIETAWIADKLIFRAERFDDLAREMERKYNVKISIRDEKVKNYQLTGIFNNESITEALKLLQVIVPFKYKINDDEIIVEN